MANPAMPDVVWPPYPSESHWPPYTYVASWRVFWVTWGALAAASVGAAALVGLGVAVAGVLLGLFAAAAPAMYVDYRLEAHVLSRLRYGRALIDAGYNLITPDEAAARRPAS